MAEVVRHKDWSKTPLGSIQSWSEALVSTMNLMLTSPFSFAVYWGKQQILLYNDTYRQFLGERHPAALGSPGPEIWKEAWPFIGKPIDEAFLNAIVTNRTDVLIPIFMKDQLEDRYWTYCFYPIYAQGEIAGVANIGHDSTSSVVTSQRLKDSEERTRLALKAANSVGIWDWDISSNRVFADENFSRMYGVDPERAAHGVPIAEFVRNIHPEDADRVDDLIQEAIRTGGEYNTEYRIVQADGSICWALALGRCSYAPDGSPLRFTGVTTDITERRKNQDVLLQTEKLAAVGRLASSIAHEINNPLEAVMNLLYLVRSEESTPEQRLEYLGSAERELSRVSAITNQTLRFHKQSSSPTSVSLHELVEGALLIHHGRLLNARVDTQSRYREQTAVRCFEGEIRQVITNLIGNGIDAMPSGGNLLVRTREATCLTTHRRGISLTVADTGSGMSASTQKKIFAPFFTTKGARGTGLGLWVSMEIIERHHGKLLVRSSQRAGFSGTVFTLFLPFDAVTRQTETDGQLNAS